jgi:hypothetical protein
MELFPGFISIRDDMQYPGDCRNADLPVSLV